MNDSQKKIVSFFAKTLHHSCLAKCWARAWDVSPITKYLLTISSSWFANFLLCNQIFLTIWNISECAWKVSLQSWLHENYPNEEKYETAKTPNVKKYGTANTLNVKKYGTAKTLWISLEKRLYLSLRIQKLIAVSSPWCQKYLFRDKFYRVHKIRKTKFATALCFPSI